MWNGICYVGKIWNPWWVGFYFKKRCALTVGSRNISISCSFQKKLSANFGVPMWVLSQKIVGSRAMVEFDGVLHLSCFGFRWGKVTRILGGLLLIRNVDIMWRMG